MRYVKLWRLRQQAEQRPAAAAAGGDADAAAAGQQQGAGEGIPGLQILAQQMRVRTGLVDSVCGGLAIRLLGLIVRFAPPPCGAAHAACCAQ